METISLTAGEGAATDAGAAARADAGTGAEGYRLSEGSAFCARESPAQALKARMRTQIGPAKRLHLHEREAQLTGITTIRDGDGDGLPFSLLLLDAHLGIDDDRNRRPRWTN
ncbi:MAG: hypothetical protein WAK26_10920 [Terracidiphilus sp.]